MPALQQSVEPSLHEPLDRLFGDLLEHLAANRFRDVFIDKIECGLRSVLHA